MRWNKRKRPSVQRHSTMFRFLYLKWTEGVFGAPERKGWTFQPRSWLKLQYYYLPVLAVLWWRVTKVRVWSLHRKRIVEEHVQAESARTEGFVLQLTLFNTMSRRGAAHMSLLWLYLLLPSLMCENMLCYYSPYSTKETQGMFKLVVTECPPKHVCYKAQGYYGAHATLTQRGCMLLESCSQGKKISLRGAIFNTTYSCCEWNYCNSSPSTSDTMIRVFISTAALILLLMEN